MTFGENIRTLRISRALSQKDLAEELGFSFQNISKWERNESLPDIETLLAIARFFGTTTDALLGYAPETSVDTLRIDRSEVTVRRAYSAGEERMPRHLLLAIDRESRIAGIVYIPWMFGYREGYIREGYAPLDENSTLIYEYPRHGKKRGETVMHSRRVRIPEGGFVISMSNRTFAAKKIMQFILPEEYAEYLDRETHEGYRNNRNGKFLLSDILRRNELDHITVEETGGGFVFKKPAETVDPMTVNIEALSKLVRRELQKEHNKQIEDLRCRLEELAGMIDDIDDFECMNDDFEERISDLERQLAELENRLEEREA